MLRLGSFSKRKEFVFRSIKSRVDDISTICLILIVGLLLLLPIFAKGFLLHQDHPGHLAKAYFYVGLIPEQHWINGWCNIDNAGFPIGLYEYPLGYWIITLIYYLSFGKISLAFAYKLLLYVSFVSPSISLYFLVKPWYKNRMAIILALFLILQSEYLDFVISIGIWSQILSVSFLLIFLKYLFNFFSDSLNYKMALKLGLIFSLILLSHLFSAIVAFFSIVICLLIYIVQEKSSVYKAIILSALIIGSSFIYSAFFLFPIIKTWGWVTPLHLFEGTLPLVIGYLLIPKNRVPREIFLNRLLASPISYTYQNIMLHIPELIICSFSLLGLLYFVKHHSKTPTQTRNVLVFFLIFSPVLFLVSVGVLRPFLSNIPVLNVLHETRFVVYVRLGLITFSGYGGTHVYRSISQFISKPKLKIAVPIVLSLFIIFFIINYSIIYRTYTVPSMITSESYNGMTDIQNIWTWIEENVNGTQTRVMYQDTFLNSNDETLSGSHIFTLSTQNTGVPSMGVSSTGANIPVTSLLATIKINEISIKELANFLENFNCKYIVSCEKELSKRLQNSSLFKMKYSSGDFYIFDLVNYSPSYIEIDNARTKAALKTFTGDKIEINVENAFAGCILVLKFTYHPNWKAWINGTEIQIKKTSLGLMMVEFGSNGNFSIELRYTKTEYVGSLLSALSLIFTVFIFHFKKRNFRD